MNDSERIEKLIGLLEPSIKKAVLKIISDARKEAYSLGFDTAKKSYSYKMIPISKVNSIYRDISTAYQQTTGIKKDLFIDFLNDKQLEELKDD